MHKGREFSPEQAQAQEAKIARCMRAAGVRYVPFVAVDNNDDEPQIDSPRTLSEAQKYGYGLTTLHADPSEIDPNEEIYQNLTAHEQRTWDATMYGPRGDRKSGCLHEAGVKVVKSTDIPPIERSSFRALRGRLDRLEKQITEAPQMVVALSAWSRCMTHAGHPAAKTPGAGFDIVLHRIGTATGVDVDAVGWNSDMLDVIAPELHRDLQDFERSIATADYQCTVPLNEIRHRVRVDLEREFIASNSADLERLRKAIRAER